MDDEKILTRMNNESTKKELDFVVNEISKLEVLCNPKTVQNMCLGDIRALGIKVATVCKSKLLKIKSEL